MLALVLLWWGDRELSATDMDFRVRALWGHPPPDTTSLAELRVAIA